jgi:hypothetical protein
VNSISELLTNPATTGTADQRMWAVQVGHRDGRKFFKATIHNVAATIQATQHKQSLYEIVGSIHSFMLHL